ncbi:hypothetical protein EDC04DRAFT_2601157 [Pisolithus marmoratus]|nr:hypothetical protein EDC04DRAFT_2601157 [Pisolithus marmoratus]
MPDAVPSAQSAHRRQSKLTSNSPELDKIFGARQDTELIVQQRTLHFTRAPQIRSPWLLSGIEEMYMYMTSGSITTIVYDTANASGTVRFGATIYDFCISGTLVYQSSVKGGLNIINSPPVSVWSRGRLLYTYPVRGQEKKPPNLASSEKVQMKTWWLRSSDVAMHSKALRICTGMFIPPEVVMLLTMEIWCMLDVPSALASTHSSKLYRHCTSLS